MKTRLILCLAPLVFGSGLTTAAAESAPAAVRPVLTLEGKETVRIPATRARLTAMVETEARSPTEAQATVKQRSQSVLAFLQRSNVDRLQAGAMTLYPVYDEPRPVPSSPSGQPPEVVAYRAQWSAGFEIDAASAGEVADGLVKAGAGRIANFVFTATDEALAEAERRALQAAAVRAREDAKAVLGALGYTAREVVRIEVKPSGLAQPYARRAETMSALLADVPATVVEPGVIEVGGVVTLDVSYE
jgi:uncharacterized protein YggE